MLESMDIKKCTRFLMFMLLMTGIFISAPAQKKKRKRQQKVSAVISTARSYLGTPYRWGGNSKRGIDCSGLIHNAYKSIGIALPRTAKAQSKVGQKKGWVGIKPGDIVYFKFKSAKNRWWHSGMITYVSDHKIGFIHASSSRGVVESNLLSDYYKKNVKSFRRVIK